MATDAITKRALEIKAQVDDALTRHLECLPGPGPLRGAMGHAVLGPAKRVRSVLVVLTGEAFGVAEPTLIQAATAVEMVHAASLVLDDLPAMDDATERRGAPPTHVQFGEATAILTAISLLNEGYRVLATLEGVPARAAADATREMAEAVGVAGLASGQWRDLNPMPEADAATIAETHAGKTGALFGAALAIPAAMAGQSLEQVAKFRAAGIEIGTAFQGYDDLLDRYANRAVIGKDTSADENRRTVADVMDREVALDWCEAHLRRSIEALAAMGLSNGAAVAYIESLAAALSAPLEVDPRRIA